jgi:GntR family transcriptional regulator
MASTFASAPGVVNPEPSLLGHTVRDLYDWLVIGSRKGRIRRVELTPPVSLYEQVAQQLRERIFSGEFPAGSKLPSGAQKDAYPVSQPVVQRAFEVLEREGLVKMTSGSGTEVLPRRRFRVVIGARLPWDDKIRGKALAAVKRALTAAASHPAVSDAIAERGPSGLSVSLMVESADIAGAVTVALAVAEQALEGIPATAISAAEEAHPAGGDGE